MIRIRIDLAHRPQRELGDGEGVGGRENAEGCGPVEIREGDVPINTRLRALGLNLVRRKKFPRSLLKNEPLDEIADSWRKVQNPRGEFLAHLGAGEGAGRLGEN